jgi:hypothetical protein
MALGKFCNSKVCIFKPHEVQGSVIFLPQAKSGRTCTGNFVLPTRSIEHCSRKHNFWLKHGWYKRTNECIRERQIWFKHFRNVCTLNKIPFRTDKVGKNVRCLNCTEVKPDSNIGRRSSIQTEMLLLLIPPYKFLGSCWSLEYLPATECSRHTVLNVQVEIV